MLPSTTTMRAWRVPTVMRLTRADAIGAHESAQRFKDDDAAVFLLELLEDREPGATDGERGAVQGVGEPRLGFRLGAVADLGAARLKIAEPRAARDLAIRILPRQPHLEIVALG